VSSAQLGTTYLGLRLTNPVVASAGPLTGNVDSLRRLEDAGIGAVVLPSLFEEDVVGTSMLTYGLYSPPDGVSAESETYLPELPAAPTVVERHLQLVADAKAAVSVPVIASVNGSSPGGWVRYASDLVDAGADAIECNTYFVAADPAHSGADVEAHHLDLVRAVRNAVRVPVAVKLSPFLSATAHTAVEILAAGADGLVLFNRFYQPDIDLDTLAVTPTLDLSTSADLRLPLRWIAILRGHTNGSLALSSGVHTSDDVVKAVLAGADAVMTTSAVLRHGPEHVSTLLRGLREWLDEREYESVEQARGSVSRAAAADPDAYERSNYVQVIHRHMRAFSPKARPSGTVGS
jgi:dihydroorotate dehydrogenase (fumarate)